MRKPLTVDMFKLAEPSVILLDELVTFAHQLSDNRSEAFASYMPSLQGTAKWVPGISTALSCLDGAR
jgi:hypothetical protein